MEGVAVYVDEGEYEVYKKAQPEVCFERMPRGVQGNVSRVRNYILDDVFERKGGDVVIMSDDDVVRFGFRYEDEEGKEVRTWRMDFLEFLHTMETCLIMCKDTDVYLCGFSWVADDLLVTGYDFLSFKAFVSGRLVIIRKNPLRYDEALPLRDDYDYVLQHLKRYGRVLRMKTYFHEVYKDVSPGGCGVMRNPEIENEQTLRLKRKWGKLVKVDRLGVKSGKERRITDRLMVKLVLP
jgi:hypothetical protein